MRGRESPLSAEVLGEDQFVRTGATVMEVLVRLRAGMCQTNPSLLAVLRLGRCLGEASYLKADSKKEAKKLIS
jgi:hypothetical protein